MPDHEVERSSTTEGLPVAPSMGEMLVEAHIPARSTLISSRVLFVCAMAVGLGFLAGLVAQVLKHLIGLVTNVAFYGRWSSAFAQPAGGVAHLGAWVIVIPVAGGIVVGLMARYGSRAIRGHGIPEAMEQVLTNQSKIPARMTWLKPLSAAIAIGTGGPFGAEGPIIATGGALGSLLGQIFTVTIQERKTLLAAGAAAGMAATFGSPVSAVLLAVELLLFEFRPRSLIPVALGAATATGVHFAFEGAEPVFAMGTIAQPSGEALAFYIAAGGVIGFIAMAVTRAVYAIEDGFEHLPIHWMWWPAIGGLAVGVIGYFVPLTLGVGYSNITAMLNAQVPEFAAAKTFLAFAGLLCVAKFFSWAISLGSGTSGGTLAPLFTIGGALGVLLGFAGNYLMPGAHIDPRVMALVGMAAIFAGASRALLASAVFAFETTLQPMGLLPLLGGCTMSYLVSCLLMRNTIMTEKLARRGTRVPAEYEADFLDTVLVRDAASTSVTVLRADHLLRDVRAWLESGAGEATHQGFPVVDGAGHLVGVLTRRNLLDAAGDPAVKVQALIQRPPSVVFDDSTLREAADHMVNHDVGRLPVMSRKEPAKLVGILTRSDVLKAHRRRLHADSHRASIISIPFLKIGGA